MSENIIVAIVQSMPLAMIIIALVFLKDIKKLFAKASINSITISGMSLNLDSKSVKKLADFLTDAMNSNITCEEWRVFSKIAASIDDGNTNTAKEILGWDLLRNKNGVPEDEATKLNLKRLRALRGFGLIAPKQIKSHWDNNSNIVVTEFGMYVAKHPTLSKLIK